MSSFEYACFVSYRNSREVQGRLNTFTRALVEEIKYSIEAYLEDSTIQDASGRFIFLDQDVFQNYDFDPVELGRGVCKSICWVVLCTRNYFGGSLWCASELEGMLRLEKIRLGQIEQSANPDFGFTIPVLITGDDSNLPRELRKRDRHLLDFRRFFLRKNFTNDDDFADLLTKLLDNIGRVQSAVLAKNTDICTHCDGFKLIDVRNEEGQTEISSFITEIIRPPQPTT